MNSCDAFRRALEVSLMGSPDATRLSELGWHEHLLGCADCRLLLEQEEALELLLASMPQPELPPELTTRVLARLRREGPGLDQLLELDAVQVPADLSARVRDGVAAQLASGTGARREPFEQLLERAGRVELPLGLTQRVLAGLAAERELQGQLQGQPRRPAPLRRVGGGGRAGWRFAAAAGILLSGGIFWLASRPGGDPSTARQDELVIAWLPALEYWDQVRELGSLEGDIVLKLDEVDQVLLEEAR